jgi:ribosomal protein S18 acetylase RimI-like enzyme
MAAVMAATHLFDGLVRVAAAERFLAAEGHYLLIGYIGDEPAGFTTGVEMTHPDKGTEMFLYELGVDERFRGQGLGTALVSALRELAREHGCYGMWVLTDADNAAALATYSETGAGDSSNQVMLTWDLRQDRK